MTTGFLSWFASPRVAMRVNIAGGARADEERAIRAERHGTCVGHLGKKTDLESRRQTNLIQRKVLGGGRGSARACAGRNHP